MPTQKINIKDIALSLDETHHIYHGKPLYAERYERVLSFHSTKRFQNGIAPVAQKQNAITQAFFIDTEGKKVFDKNFYAAFGFYENLAAVCDSSGFYHINDCGKRAYNHSFAWCGNFTNGACVVKDSKGYFHIDSQGNALYKERYTYAGDFVYNIAVVLLSNGKSTHICKDGSMLHGIYFDELEPYHKGVAVAKDSKGYFHIDKYGRALYKERYSKLEPFYNGRAYAIGSCGERCVVCESDCSCEILGSKDSQSSKSCMPNKAHQNVLLESALNLHFSRLAFSFMPLQILRAILELNILESVWDKTPIELEAYPKKLVLSWLMENGYIKETSTDSYILTHKGEGALKLKDVLCYWLDLPYITSHKLAHSLKHNSESFSSIFHKGYFDLLQDDCRQKELFSAISSFYASDYMDYGNWADISSKIVCDIGCGSGRLLDNLVKRNPTIKAIYADKIDLRLEKHGEFMQIDFFKPLAIYADIFIMSRILHDYDDTGAIKILQNVACSMRTDSRLYIIESIQDTNKYDIEVAFHLLNFLGGKERSIDEYRELFVMANLELVCVKRLQGIMSLLEVRLKG